MAGKTNNRVKDKLYLLIIHSNYKTCNKYYLYKTKKSCEKRYMSMIMNVEEKEILKFRQYEQSYLNDLKIKMIRDVKEMIVNGKDLSKARGLFNTHFHSSYEIIELHVSDCNSIDAYMTRLKNKEVVKDILE